MRLSEMSTFGSVYPVITLSARFERLRFVRFEGTVMTSLPLLLI